MRAHVYIWRQCNKDPSATLGMTVLGERMGSYLGDMLRVLELAVLYYDTSSPLEKGRAKGAGWMHEAV